MPNLLGKLTSIDWIGKIPKFFRTLLESMYNHEHLVGGRRRRDYLMSGRSVRSRQSRGRSGARGKPRFLDPPLTLVMMIRRMIMMRMKRKVFATEGWFDASEWV